MSIYRATINGPNQTKTFLFFWTGVFMYIGKAVDTSIHDHHAIQIAISFDEPIEIRLPDISFKLKAAIIDSDQPHECRTYNSTFLLINIARKPNRNRFKKKLSHKSKNCKNSRWESF